VSSFNDPHWVIGASLWLPKYRRKKKKIGALILLSKITSTWTQIDIVKPQTTSPKICNKFKFKIKSNVIALILQPNQGLAERNWFQHGPDVDRGNRLQENFTSFIFIIHQRSFQIGSYGKVFVKYEIKKLIFKKKT
jgi:hypothetical protein